VFKADDEYRSHFAPAENCCKTFDIDMKATTNLIDCKSILSQVAVSLAEWSSGTSAYDICLYFYDKGIAGLRDLSHKDLELCLRTATDIQMCDEDSFERAMRKEQQAHCAGQ
jgi:hypothetical protein